MLEKLEYAKKAVIWLVENADGSVDFSVDFHGLTYWASEVERLRKEIKEHYKDNPHETHPRTLDRKTQGRRDKRNPRQ